MFARLLSAALLLVAAAPAPPARPTVADQQALWTQQCKDWDTWDKRAPPFKVYGDTYYVGTCGISAILIVSHPGAILIDGGPADAGVLVARNVEKLGFKLSHVTLLLHSHEHHDHVGGLAELQRLTGAPVFASAEAALALRSGGPSKDDPQFAEHGTFPAVKVRQIIGDGETFKIGDLALQGIATPGHTPGAMSWQWQSCEGQVCKTIVYADSLTPVSSDDYRFGDHPEYLAAFRTSLARIAALKCDILLSPHPSASGMRDRLLKGDLTDPQGCKAYAARLSKQLDERLAKEANDR